MTGTTATARAPRSAPEPDDGARAICVTPSSMLALLDDFRIHAVDIYGLSEVIGPGVANECVEDKGALTVWEDHFYPEVIDPSTGEVLPEGEHGELVFTSLTKQALPVIRYRTGDLTSLSPGTTRTMRRRGEVTGRVDDMLIVRGVTFFSPPRWRSCWSPRTLHPALRAGAQPAGSPGPADHAGGGTA